MAANEKAPMTVALQNGETRYSLHHDLAGHFRMYLAVVGIRSCLGERVREEDLVNARVPKLPGIRRRRSP
jgi:hypothetical protein